MTIRSMLLTSAVFATDGAAAAGAPAADPVSVAAGEATMKRSIQMKMFAPNKDVHAKVAYEKKPLVLGQIIGVIFDVKEKVGTLPDGTEKVSLLAIGDFEGVNYATGEVFTSTSAYLPGYYLEVAKSMLDKADVRALDFAVEIELIPTGKSIPTAYEVRNLIRRRPDSPLNRLKAELAAADRLRLPPPSTAPVLALAGEKPALDAPEPNDAEIVAANAAAALAAAEPATPEVVDPEGPLPEDGEAAADATPPADPQAPAPAADPQAPAAAPQAPAEGGKGKGGQKPA